MADNTPSLEPAAVSADRAMTFGKNCISSFARTSLRDYGPVLALLVITVALSARGIADGGFRYSDCSRHAMDGVFVHDFVADLPGSLLNPVEYAVEYYAHYPALGIPVYYPPFFAMVEAVFFTVFGISVFTARLTVVAFACLGVVMTYKFVSHIGGRFAGFLAAALFISIPSVVFWSRQVMLEIPTAAMIITASYVFYRYVELGDRRSAIWTGVLTVAAVLTKQPALYIVPAFGLYLLLQRRWDVFRHWQFWVGASIVAAFLVPFFVATYRYAHYLTNTQIASSGLSLTEKAWNVLAAWADALSWPFLVCILVSAGALIVWETARPRQPGVRIVLLLFAMFLVESIFLRLSSTRYAIIGFPILVSFVPLLLARGGWLRHVPVRGLGLGAVLCLCVLSFNLRVPAVYGYAEAAKGIVRANGDSLFIFFDGFRDGDIVFYVRQQDAVRQHYVLRGSKVLYTFASFKRHGYQEFVTTPEEFESFTRQYGLRVVAVEDKDVTNTGPGGMLRDALSRPDLFKVVDCFPIKAAGTSLDGLNVVVHRSTRPPSSPSAETLVIPLPGLQRQLEVPLRGNRPARILNTNQEQR